MRAKRKLTGVIDGERVQLALVSISLHGPKRVPLSVHLTRPASRSAPLVWFSYCGQFLFMLAAVERPKAAGTDAGGSGAGAAGAGAASAAASDAATSRTPVRQPLASSHELMLQSIDLRAALALPPTEWWVPRSMVVSSEWTGARDFVGSSRSRSASPVDERQALLRDIVLVGLCLPFGHLSRC
jgi:hypothetical protein